MNFTKLLKKNTTGDQAQLQQAKIFGNSLDEYLKMDKLRHNHTEIPLILVALCQLLSLKEFCKTENILRQQGNQNIVSELKERLEVAYNSAPVNINLLIKAISGGKTKDFTLENIHSIANIFRQFLKQVKGGVIPPSFNDKLVKLNSELLKLQDEGAKSKHKVGAKFNEIRFNINSLPGSSRDVLKYLIIFIKRLASFSGYSKMSLSSIIQVLTPCIFLKPKDLFIINDDPENEAVLNDPEAEGSLDDVTNMVEYLKLSQVLTTMVNHFDVLFGRIQQDEYGIAQYKIVFTPDELELFHGDSYEHVVKSKQSNDIPLESEDVEQEIQVKPVIDTQQVAKDFEELSPNSKQVHKKKLKDTLNQQFAKDANLSKKTLKEIKQAKLSSSSNEELQVEANKQPSQQYNNKKFDQGVADQISNVDNRKLNTDKKSLIDNSSNDSLDSVGNINKMLPSLTKSRIKNTNAKKTTKIVKNGQSEEQSGIKKPKSIIKKQSLEVDSLAQQDQINELKFQDNTSSIQSRAPSPTKSVRFSNGSKQDKPQIDKLVSSDEYDLAQNYHISQTDQDVEQNQEQKFNSLARKSNSSDYQAKETAEEQAYENDHGSARFDLANELPQLELNKSKEKSKKTKSSKFSSILSSKKPESARLSKKLENDLKSDIDDSLIEPVQFSPLHDARTPQSDANGQQDADYDETVNKEPGNIKDVEQKVSQLSIETKIQDKIKRLAELDLMIRSSNEDDVNSPSSTLLRSTVSESFKSKPFGGVSRNLDSKTRKDTKLVTHNESNDAHNNLDEEIGEQISEYFDNPQKLRSNKKKRAGIMVVSTSQEFESSPAQEKPESENYNTIIEDVEKIPSLQFNEFAAERDIKLYKIRLEQAKPVINKFQRYLKLVKITLGQNDGESELRREYYQSELQRYKTILQDYRSLKEFVGQREIGQASQKVQEKATVAPLETPFNSLDKRKKDLGQKYQDTLQRKSKSPVDNESSVNVQQQKHDIKVQIVQLKAKLKETQDRKEQEKLKQQLKQFHDTYLELKGQL